MAGLEANDQAFTYGRLGTPTVRALEEALAELEGGYATLLTPSGLSAIVATLLALVSAGDHVLVTDSVYRPTRRFCDGLLKRLGVETTYYDPLIGGRHRRPHQEEHARRVHRVAGLADLRGAGHPGDRGSRPCERARSW